MPLCLPIAAVALAAAGAGANVVGQQKAKSAMNQKTMAELLRQRGIQDKASSAFAESLSQSGKDTADSQIQEGQAQRESGYNAAQAVPLSAGSAPLVGGTSSILNLQDQAQLSQSNKSRAKLGSYDKWQLDQMVKNVRAGQQQGLLGQQASRSQAILPMELQDASHKGDGWSNAGTVLGALGTLASLGSMAGVGAGTTAAANTGAMSAAQQAAMVAAPLGSTAGAVSNTAPLISSGLGQGFNWGGLASTGAGLGYNAYGLRNPQRQY